jgi:hypothetical protein
MPTTILICGSPADGFQIVGLFADSGDAESYAKDVCAENSDSNVLVMKPTDQGVRHDASDLLNRPRDRRILVQ